jgi:uncharacterized alpha-E superfamily protein
LNIDALQLDTERPRSILPRLQALRRDVDRIVQNAKTASSGQQNGAPRLDFDRRLMLRFRGSTITSRPRVAALSRTG